MTLWTVYFLSPGICLAMGTWSSQYCLSNSSGSVGLPNKTMIFAKTNHSLEAGCYGFVFPKLYVDAFNFYLRDGGNLDAHFFYLASLLLNRLPPILYFLFHRQ